MSTRTTAQTVTAERLERLHRPGPVRVVRTAPAAPVSDAGLAARLRLLASWAKAVTR